MTKYKFIIFFLAASLLWSCKKDPKLEEDFLQTIEAPTPYKLILPKNFPPLPVPKSNPLTVEGVALGKKLFYGQKIGNDISNFLLAEVFCPALVHIASVEAFDDVSIGGYD